MRVIFWGTSDFAVPSLERIYEHGYKIVGVVTSQEKQAGRGLKLIASPVKIAASKLNLICLEPANPNTQEVYEIIKNLQADICVLAAYGFIIKSQLLNLPSKGFVNIHPSLLPKYRGAAPIQRAIMNGEKITGVTTFYMNEEMDAGDIILQETVPIGDDETYDEVKKRLAKLGADLIIKTLIGIQENTVTRTPQDHSQKSIAKKIKKEECLIDWQKPTRIVHNLIRGLSLEPGAYTYFRNKRVKIFKSTIPTQKSTIKINEPGRMFTENKRLFVFTQDGYLEILLLQLEGGKIINAIDFINGQRISLEDKFCNQMNRTV
ncbi:MAG: methionyl-tRNA formyltransferase [candidate division WOR-3 bacterium]